MNIETKRKITLVLSATALLLAAGTAWGFDAQMIKSLYLKYTNAASEKTTQIDICESTASRLKKQGFTHVHPTNCSGYQLAYNGFRGTTEVTIIYDTKSNGQTVITK